MKLFVEPKDHEGSTGPRIKNLIKDFSAKDKVKTIVFCWEIMNYKPSPLSDLIYKWLENEVTLSFLTDHSILPLAASIITDPHQDIHHQDMCVVLAAEMATSCISHQDLYKIGSFMNQRLELIIWYILSLHPNNEEYKTKLREEINKFSPGNIEWTTNNIIDILTYLQDEINFPIMEGIKLRILPVQGPIECIALSIMMKYLKIFRSWLGK